MLTKAEIFEKVREVIVDALGVDEDEVVPEAVLTGDLGAESIDFLDIAFRLEKQFKVKVPRGKIDLRAIEAVIPSTCGTVGSRTRGSSTFARGGRGATSRSSLRIHCVRTSAGFSLSAPSARTWKHCSLRSRREFECPSKSAGFPQQTAFLSDS